jgi:hypothetical protein
LNKQEVFELLGENRSYMKTKNQRYGILQIGRFVQICANQVFILKPQFDKLKAIVLYGGGM